MENHDRPSGKIESTETMWDVLGIEKEYYNDGIRTSPKRYTGNGEILFERSSPESKTSFKEMIRPLSDNEKKRENHLIFVLSNLYGKRNGKYLSKVLK